MAIATFTDDAARSQAILLDRSGGPPYSPNRPGANEYKLHYKYANGVDLYVSSGGTGIRMEGTDGWVEIPSWRKPLKASSPSILKSVIGKEETHLFTCPQGEHRNFLDCVRSRKDPYFPVDVGHAMATLMHIGNISMRLGRKLKWDPTKEAFVGDAEADRMRSREMRKPWTI